MKRNIVLVVAAALTVCSLAGCKIGGGKQLYTAPDDSFSLTLPSNDWVVSTEDEEQGMYAFSLPAENSSDSEDETVSGEAVDTEDGSFDTQAIIIYFDLSADAGNLGYETIPTTQEELEASLGTDIDYELLDFDGDLNEDGVKSNLYSIKFTSDGQSGYIVSKTEADENSGYIIAGEVLSDNFDLVDDIKDTIDSIERS